MWPLPPTGQNEAQNDPATRRSSVRPVSKPPSMNRIAVGAGRQRDHAARSSDRAVLPVLAVGARDGGGRRIEAVAPADLLQRDRLELAPAGAIASSRVSTTSANAGVAIRRHRPARRIVGDVAKRAPRGSTLCARVMRVRVSRSRRIVGSYGAGSDASGAPSPSKSATGGRVMRTRGAPGWWVARISTT